MRNLLALIGLVVVLVAGGGWYLGWYKLSSESSDSGHRKINVDVDQQKIKEDLTKGEQAVGGILQHNQDDKPVQGQTTGQQKGGSWGIVPTVPPLPESPPFRPLELSPDGTPTLIPPPPPSFPGNK